MLSREINLNSATLETHPELVRLKSTISKSLPLILAVYSLLLALVLTYSYYLSHSLQTVEKNISDEQAKIEGLAKNEGLFLTLKQKATALTSLFASRFPYTDLYTFFMSFASDNVTISGLTFAPQGHISMIVSFKGSGDIDAFINKITSEAKARFGTVELTSVSLGSDLSYSVVFSIVAKS